MKTGVVLFFFLLLSGALFGNEPGNIGKNFFISTKLPVLRHVSVTSGRDNPTTTITLNAGQNGLPFNNSTMLLGFKVDEKIWIAGAVWSDFDDILHLSAGGRYYIWNYDTFAVYTEASLLMFFMEEQNRIGIDIDGTYEVYLGEQFALGGFAGIGYVADFYDFYFNGGLSMSVYFNFQ